MEVIIYVNTLCSVFNLFPVDGLRNTYPCCVEQMLYCPYMEILDLYREERLQNASFRRHVPFFEERDRVPRGREGTRRFSHRLVAPLDARTVATREGSDIYLARKFESKHTPALAHINDGNRT